MIWTRANVAEYAKEKGLEPVNIEGIPDGFVWKAPDLAFNGVPIVPDMTLFIPLTDKKITSGSVWDLLEYYVNTPKERPYGTKKN